MGTLAGFWVFGMGLLVAGVVWVLAAGSDVSAVGGLLALAGVIVMVAAKRAAAPR